MRNMLDTQMPLRAMVNGNGLPRLGPNGSLRAIG